MLVNNPSNVFCVHTSLQPIYGRLSLSIKYNSFTCKFRQSDHNQFILHMTNQTDLIVFTLGKRHETLEIFIKRSEFVFIFLDIFKILSISKLMSHMRPIRFSFVRSLYIVDVKKSSHLF